MSPKIFPCIMIILDIAAAIVYARHKDWWMVGYWVSAAVLTICVTFKP